ncbi:MAG TPA: hypothetical protein VE776_12260 [Actinomycetota bacterium]|nr:hypothetical protein [Actinomycetota bacterium]
MRPDPAGLQPIPAAPAGTNGQFPTPGEQALGPAVDAALPSESIVSSLGPFAALLGQPYQRLKAVALRALSALETTSWPLVRAEAALDWLDPGEADKLLEELRTDGLLIPARNGTWRLSDEAQLVAAVSAVLAVPRIEPERVVRVLGAVTTLALAAGTGAEPAVAPLLAAFDVLDADLEALLRLIDEGDDRSLHAGAWLARTRAADLIELLERERERLAGLGVAPHVRAALRRAPELARRVRELAEEVEATFAVPASELPPGSLKVDAGELRTLIATTDPESLRRMVEPRLPRPPGVACLGSDCGEALAALNAWLGRAEQEVAPLPQPRRLRVEPMDVVPDFVELAAQALSWLANLGDATLDKWVVGGTWSEASARMSAAVEAWSRWGPFGNSTLAADLDPRPRLEVVGHDEVAVTTRTEVRRPVTESPAEPEEAGATTEEAGATTQAEAAVAPAEPDPDPLAREEPTL